MAGISHPIGSILGGRYLIERLLGAGGMGTVYAARDELLGRAVAVKVFAAGAAEVEDLRRQEAEVRLVASLQHPGIVTLFDAGVDDAGSGPASRFFVMELVDGPDLRDRIARGGTLSPADVARFGADLAEALHYVHDRGVVHRDIKPANVLLAPPASRGARPQAKLTDFGIARIMNGATRLTATNATIGTATYFSPEQAAGVPLTGASDVYSLGLILLECLTGAKAFPGEAIPSAIARLTRDPEVPAALGADWTALLQRMTAREPEARPAAAVVADALVALSSSGSLSETALVLPVVAGSGSIGPDQATLLYPQATQLYPQAAASAGTSAADTRTGMRRPRTLALAALVLALLLGAAVWAGSAMAPATQTAPVPSVIQPGVTESPAVSPSPTRSSRPTPSPTPTNTGPGNSGKNNDKKNKN